jgi:hypothetical protein
MDRNHCQDTCLLPFSGVKGGSITLVTHCGDRRN